MIVVDIETSGLDLERCGIWQIGAVDLNNIENTFFEDARIDEDDVIEQGALKVTGKTEKDLRDKSKQSQKELLIRFFDWVEEQKIKIMVSQNPQTLDYSMLVLKADKYRLKFPFQYRVLDLHSISQMKYFELNGEFLLVKNKSDMGLGNILKLVGMVDLRKEHNALEDAKLCAECFSRIIYGKSLFEEYFKFKIPKYLKLEGF